MKCLNSKHNAGLQNTTTSTFAGYKKSINSAITYSKKGDVIFAPELYHRCLLHVKWPLLRSVKSALSLVVENPDALIADQRDPHRLGHALR